MIILYKTKGQGRGGAYHKRPDCQLFQLAFLTYAGDYQAEQFTPGEFWWYCHNHLDFCFSAEQFRKLIEPLLASPEKRQERREKLLSNPLLAEQLAIYSKTPHKPFREAIKEWYNICGMEKEI